MENPVKYLYNGAFCSELCVTLPYSEPEEYSESCQGSMVQHFLRILCNPGIFRVLVHSEPEEYSEPCQASII